MILTSTLMGIAISVAANPNTPVNEACVEIPPGASAEVEMCLREECKAFQVAFAACNGDSNCQALVRATYMLAAAQCFPVAKSHEWATIWYADGEYGVAFDLWDVPEHAVRFEF